MYNGKFVFAQIMDFMPWKQFQTLVKQFHGDKKVHSLTCADYFRVMAFAQITYRDSLRDTVIGLQAVRQKLYHLGIRADISRNNISHAGMKRDYRIFEQTAHLLIKQAQELYQDDPLDIKGVTTSVFALDSTTIDLCLSLFPWADFRKTKAAIKLHTLIDIRGNIPLFIHISKGKMPDVKVLDVMKFIADAFYVLDRAYLDFRRLHRIHQSGAFFVTRSKKTPNGKEYPQTSWIKRVALGVIKLSLRKESGLVVCIPVNCVA